MARFDRAIPPGGEGKITLEVRTKGYQGKFHKTGQVITNDPKNLKVSIALKGTMWLPIHMKPGAALLKGIVGEDIETVVHLRGEKEDPLVLQLDSVSIPEKVSAELREVEKGRSYELKLKNRVKEDETYAGEARITTNYPDKPEIRVPIYGGIRAIVQVMPKSLSFGRMSEERLEVLKQTGGSMSRPVMVVLNRGDDLKISKIELEKSLFKVVTRDIQPGRRLQLLVEPILDKVTRGLNEDHLKIYTNHADHETIVPISFEVHTSSKKGQPMQDEATPQALGEKPALEQLGPEEKWPSKSDRDRGWVMPEEERWPAPSFPPVDESWPRVKEEWPDESEQSKESGSPSPEWPPAHVEWK